MPLQRILITGAGGLVGAHAAQYFCQEYEVHALVRSRPAGGDPRIQYHEGDLTGGRWLAGLPERMDAVFHLAQASHMRDFPEHALEMFGVNTQATSRLLDYALTAKASHFVFASTGGLYGSGPAAFDEDSPIALPAGPLAYYFRSKLAGEILARGYDTLMNVSILRPFFVYGRNQKRAMLIPRLADNVRHDIPITLYGEHGIRVNPVHVGDVVRLLQSLLARSESQVINVAGAEVVTMRTLVEMLADRLGRKPVFVTSDSAQGDVLADNKRMRSIYSSPLVSLEQGLADVL